MSIIKEFIIIVKSIKDNNYCVAGRAIERVNGGIRLLDEWVRPVSSKTDQGAVSEREMHLSDSLKPRFLDVIQIEVEKNEGNKIQPENWVLSGSKWKKLGSVSLASISDFLVENPADLWGSNCSQTHKLTTQAYYDKGFNSSIYMIEPEYFEMQIYYEDYAGRPKQKRRAIMHYKGLDYNLPITDQDINKLYFSDFPNPGDKKKTILLNSKRCLVAVSLTPEWNGYHYKIVGRIIEL
jgi:hypothetical protein